MPEARKGQNDIGQTPSLSQEALVNNKLDNYEFQSISVKTPREEKPIVQEKLDTEGSQVLGSINLGEEDGQAKGEQEMQGEAQLDQSGK